MIAGTSRFPQVLAGAFLDFDDLATLIVTALRARAMRQLALVAVGTLGQRLRRQMIVCAALGRACLGMTPFRIWHEYLVIGTARRTGSQNFSFAASS